MVYSYNYLLEWRNPIVADPGAARGPVIKNHKKMAAKGDRIDFTFLAPPPAAGSATVLIIFCFIQNVREMDVNPDCKYMWLCCKINIPASLQCIFWKIKILHLRGITVIVQNILIL